MVYDLDSGKVAVSAAPVALDVAAAESVTVVPETVMVVLAGMPVPVIVSPVARPSIEETAVTDVLPLAMVPVKATGVVPLTLTTTFCVPVGIGV
jgi:hypothetical protein